MIGTIYSHFTRYHTEILVYCRKNCPSRTIRSFHKKSWFNFLENNGSFLFLQEPESLIWKKRRAMWSWKFLCLPYTRSEAYRHETLYATRLTVYGTKYYSRSRDSMLFIRTRHSVYFTVNEAVITRKCNDMTAKTFFSHTKLWEKQLKPL